MIYDHTDPFPTLNVKPFKCIFQNPPRQAGQDVTAAPQPAEFFYVVVVGYRWEEVPKKYGTKSALHLRYTKLMDAGVWKKIFVAMIKMAHVAGKLDPGKVSVDSAIVAKKKETM